MVGEEPSVGAFSSSGTWLFEVQALIRSEAKIVTIYIFLIMSSYGFIQFVQLLSQRLFHVPTLLRLVFLSRQLVEGDRPVFQG